MYGQPAQNPGSAQSIVRAHPTLKALTLDYTLTYDSMSIEYLWYSYFNQLTERYLTSSRWSPSKRSFTQG